MDSYKKENAACEKEAVSGIIRQREKRKHRKNSRMPLRGRLLLGKAIACEILRTRYF